MNRSRGLIAILMPMASLGALLVSVPSAVAAPVPGTSKVYTTDADFDQGTLVDVNHDAPNNNQLQLGKAGTVFSFVNIAASARGTIVKIDGNSGAIAGEYLTAPDGMGRNPSRTTVDRLGNVWVANRDEAGGGKGSVARIGVVLGGTRANADGTPNPVGEYLKGPFGYNTCRLDSNGLIKTSRGLGDIRPWTNSGGVDSNGGVSSADDGCIINYTRVTGTGTRTVAVDAANNVWVGGLTNREHEKLSGVTGDPVPGTQVNFNCGGYGGFVDSAGTLWSSGGGAGLLRLDTTTLTGNCLDESSHGDYGLGLDPNSGEIWHTFLSGNRVAKLAPNGDVLGVFQHGNDNAQGVAVDGNGNVWVAHSLLGPATTVGHLRTDGTLVGTVTLPGGVGPTGVAIGSQGKVWVTNIDSNNAQRIDPSAGPTGGGGFPVGAVDLTVDLGAGAGPYNYSDMTGAVLGAVTSPIGTWTVVQDGGAAGINWGKVTWNTEPQGSEPPGTSIVFEARSADIEADLSAQAFVAVSNGAAFSLTGRFIEVRATLKPDAAGVSPVLSDVNIESTAVAEADLSITKTDFPDPVRVGRTVTYTINVTNNGPSPATTVMVTDTLPTGATLISATASQGSCGGSITCNLGNLASGATATVTIKVKFTSKGKKTDTTTVNGLEIDPNLTNNTAKATTTVRPKDDDDDDKDKDCPTGCDGRHDLNAIK